MKTEPVPPPAGRPCGPGPLSAAESLAAYGPEHLADAQLLEVLLEEPSLMRAAGLLEACGGLGNLLGLGPADLVSLGLTSAEAARIRVLVEVQRWRTRGHRAGFYALGIAWAYGNAITSRKPTMRGSYLYMLQVRNDERMFGAGKLQLPPRATRTLPLGGPCGSTSGERV